jgi:hypothetical protein
MRPHVGLVSTADHQAVRIVAELALRLVKGDEGRHLPLALQASVNVRVCMCRNLSRSAWLTLSVSK